MIFTRHAYERYRQFHMLDQPQATDDDARQILERYGSTAVQANAKTHRGDPVWFIEALGVELVAKHEDGVVTCVTVLPPPQFRGLTPLQAERVEESVREAKARAAEAEREVALAKALLAEAKERRTVARAVAAPNRKLAAVTEVTAAQKRLGEVKRVALLATTERDNLCSALKTMRCQLSSEDSARKLKAALRVAVRRLREVGDEDGLAAVAAVDPGLASVAFAESDAP